MHRIFPGRAACAAAFCAAALPFAAAAAGEIYKCAGAHGGRPTYQDSPCDGSVRRSVAPEPKPERVQAGDLADATPEERRIVAILAMHQRCTHALPALGYRIAMDYQRWRSERSALVARVERDPGFQASLRSAAGEGDAMRGQLSPAQVEAQLDSCAFLEDTFAPPSRVLSEVKAALDKAAPAACEEMKAQDRMSQLDAGSAEYKRLQAERDRHARSAAEEKERVGVERKIETLPPAEQAQARKYRESLAEQCAKREGISLPH